MIQFLSKVYWIHQCDTLRLHYVYVCEISLRQTRDNMDKIQSSAWKQGY